MVLAKAEKIADSMKDEYVSVEHLMISLMENPNQHLKELFKLFDIQKNDFLQVLQQVRGNTRVTSDSPEDTYDVLKNMDTTWWRMPEIKSSTRSSVVMTKSEMSS